MRSRQYLGLAETWPAPAKLNLCLRIVGRRHDGYHLLQSAFQFVELQDELNFYPRPTGVIERIGGPLEVEAAADLAVRAAQALADHVAATTPLAHGVAIELHKRIPLQAGLGGGSSDAATTLTALNHLWGLNLPLGELLPLGLKLGADVPVFLNGLAAWAEGVGDLLTPYDFPAPTYLLVKPAVAVSTAAVFQRTDLTRNSPITTIRGFLAGDTRNDCLAVVRRHYSEVAEALDWLQQFGEARLTGTGSCVFAAFDSEGAAQRVLAAVPARWRGFVVRGLNRSPLLERLERERRGGAG
jgi:4-diphosphocytidyl-2-C-methyl-D-erythritol kinase